MSRSYLRAAGFVLVALLAFPRPGDANIIDIIWGMSGPQVFGVVVLHCKIYFDGEGSRCKSVDDIWKGKTAVLELQPKPFGPGKLRLALETIFFTSTGKDSESGDEHDFGAVKMLAVDPMLEIGSVSNERVRLYHGLGFTFDRLFVNGASDFGKFGFKIRAVGATINSTPELDVALNFRLYPDGFGRDQFGFGSAPTGDRPFEWVWGLSFGFAW